jgi:uncharacterized protein (TIGR00251 family)
VESGRLKIRITTPPEKGKANEAVVELLAKNLKVPKSSIKIVSGHTSRIKKILIVGVDFALLQEKLGVKVSESS